MKDYSEAGQLPGFLLFWMRKITVKNRFKTTVWIR